MERRLNAELWDKMHYLFRDYNDRMVHVELRYDFRIDLDILKTVVTCFFEKAPVLHSSFTDNRVHPYWTVREYHINDVITAREVDADGLDAAINDFLIRQIPTDSPIQMKLAVFYCGESSVLCLVENHMCMDGGDLKYFMKSLCKNYSDYAERHISPVDLRTGTRSYEAVYEDFTPAERKLAKSLYKNINTRDRHAFPLTAPGAGDASFIARRKLSAETFDRIRSVGKTRGATVNEMLLTAYFDSVYALKGMDPDEGFSISCAIDLRRHIADNSDHGVTNQTAWMQCRVPKRGRDIFETLDYVIRTSNEFKQDRFMGLHGLPLLSLGYKILPHAASEEIIKAGYANPLIAMSNIGILDAQGLALCGHEPTDGFMSGAVKYKPYVLLSATSLRKEISLSMCVRGNAEDKRTVERFFDLMEESIRRLTES